MSFTLTTRNDYLFTVNREAVRLYDRLGVLIGNVADAKRLMQGKRERQPSEGEYIGLAIDWRLPGSEVTVEVTPGCLITDAGGVAYRVLSVDPPGTYQGTYNCNCVSLMVLGHTIIWHYPQNATDTYGSPLVDLSGTLASMPCAIQEVACEEVVFQGIVQGFRRTYKVWLLGDVTLSFGAIGVDNTGRTLTVVNVNTRNRLDELLCVTCVVEP